MAMLYQPRPGNVVMCDYRGFVVPEMVKVRPVVVLARNRKNRRLVTIVPLSTTEPDSLEDHHHALARNPLPGRDAINCWAKCDMLTTVSLGRLDRYKLGVDSTRCPCSPPIISKPFAARLQMPST